MNAILNFHQSSYSGWPNTMGLRGSIRFPRPHANSKQSGDWTRGRPMRHVPCSTTERGGLLLPAGGLQTRTTPETETGRDLLKLETDRAKLEEESGPPSQNLGKPGGDWADNFPHPRPHPRSLTRMSSVQVKTQKHYQKTFKKQVANSETNANLGKNSGEDFFKTESEPSCSSPQ